MITVEEAKRICSAQVITDLESISVIQRYIFDMKGATVEINRPADIINIQLMNIALEVASKHYMAI